MEQLQPQDSYGETVTVSESQQALLYHKEDSKKMEEEQTSSSPSPAPLSSPNPLSLEETSHTILTLEMPDNSVENDDNEYVTVTARDHPESPYQNLPRGSSLPNAQALPDSLAKLGPILASQDPYNTFPKIFRASYAGESPVPLDIEMTPKSEQRHSTILQSLPEESSTSNVYIISPKDDSVGHNPSVNQEDSGSLTSSMVANRLYGRPELILATSGQVMKCLPMFYSLETGKAYVDRNTTHAVPVHQLIEVNTMPIVEYDHVQNPTTTTQPTANIRPDTQQPELTSMINPLYEDRFEQQSVHRDGPSKTKQRLQLDLEMAGVKVKRHHSFLYYTVIMALIVGLCLDFPVLLCFFVPALWLAKKASEEKELGRIELVKKYGRRVLILNIVGGVLHVFVIIAAVISFFSVVFAVL